MPEPWTLYRVSSSVLSVHVEKQGHRGRAAALHKVVGVRENDTATRRRVEEACMARVHDRLARLRIVGQVVEVIWS
eukprot:CAMPEP_0182544218 /NCGR_PEP_ID=MMETSP1323-20130603/32796_1 /TAXON_ID=236787 /ORGANISM="Florenciella parvula, Strain RCC1693" /LENGTH=75 /DNA_ID=CAMNT_0024755223 /DNA_START=552 /DNA_END=779 /DNA_ORIENTATION=-